MSKDAESLVRLAGVRKVYPCNGTEVSALGGIDLELRAAEYVALVGPSGSGKSTLFNMIAGLDSPTGGEVWFDGRNVAELSERERALLRRSSVGFVFQTFRLSPTMSALENCMTPMLFAGSSLREAAKRGEALLREVGLEDRAAHRPSQLSGGQQQRVAVARALANNPKLLLADEPTGNLDGDTGGQIIELLTSLSAQRGITVFSATHDEDVAAAAGRILRIRDGRLEDED